MNGAPAMVDNRSTEETLASLLDDGLFIDGDWIESKDQDPDGEVRLIQLADVGDGVFRDRSSRFLTMEKAKELRCTFLQPGDVLVARMPDPLGRACVFPGVGRPAVTAVDVCILRPSPDRVRPEWLVKAVNSPVFRSSMQEFVRGTTRQRISRKNLGTLRLSVPPVDAQRELADLIDRVELSRGSATAHVAAAQRATGRLRDALLGAACTGRLTTQWRAAHGPASKSAESLHRYLSQRAYHPRGKRAEPFEPGQLPPLPSTWTWADIDSLAADRPNALKAGPFGSSLTKAMYASAGYKVYGQEQVIAGDAHLDTYFISDAKYRELESCAVGPGDILISLVGTIGKVLVLPQDCRPGVINPRLIKLSLNSDLITSQFARMVFASPLTGAYYRRASQGSTMEILNLAILRGVPVPLPPLDEQSEIAQRVDDLLALGDRLGDRLDAATTRIARSSQAVLAKAFRGDLMSTAVTSAARGLL